MGRFDRLDFATDAEAVEKSACAAAFAEFAQFFHGALVATRELGLVAAEAVERVAVREGLAEELIAVFVLVFWLLGGGVVEFVDDGGFDAREAFETPGDVDDLVDEGFFQRGRRLEFVFDVGAVPVVVVRVFAGDEWVFGSEAVFECIACDVRCLPSVVRGPVECCFAFARFAWLLLERLMS